MTTAPPPPKPAGFDTGQAISHYKLVKRVGQGGYGEVWKAFDQRLKRPVAIKFLLGDHQDNPDARRRFEAEAVLAVRISHPSLVQMFGTGETDSGALYHVMEFVDGPSLHARLHPTPTEWIKFDLGTTLDIVWQVANVLAPLHDKGIVHRDLKPSNLILVDEPAMPHGLRVKLFDFGIAKMIDKAAARELEIEQHTTKGPHPGSQAVMAPEQWKIGAEQGPAIDTYALGVIFYRMLTGDWLFRGNLQFGHQLEDPPIITEKDPSIPVDVALLVHRMLLKNPAERPTMAEVADALGRHPSVKNAEAGQVVIRPTMELEALAARLSSGSGATADAPKGSSVDSLAPTGRADEQASAKHGLQVSTSDAMTVRRRRQLVLGGSLGLAALLGLGLAVLLNINRSANHSAAVLPAQPAPPAAVSAPAALEPNVGVNASTTNVITPATNPDAKPPSPEKRRKKKKNGLLVND